MSSSFFDKAHVLHELKHYLPAQAPIKEFIHHNSLHAFQNLKFYNAIFKASKTFGYHVTLQLSEYRQLYQNGRITQASLDRILLEKKGPDAERWRAKALSGEYDVDLSPRIGALRAFWKKTYPVDPDELVHPLLFRILASYLDQGISLWKFPPSGGGFLASLREMEKNSFTSLFKTKRAGQLLLNEETSMEQLLEIVAGDKKYYRQYLFDQQFAHHGWSGMVSAVEDHAHTLLDTRKITLHDLILFELLLEIDALDYSLGKSWQPVSRLIKDEPPGLFPEEPFSELQEVLIILQEAFEWSYYDGVLAGLLSNKKRGVKVAPAQKTFYAVFCIDERECSLRRHIESADPACETFGTPGFFSAEFYFQPQNGHFHDKLCPAPLTPKYLIKEQEVKVKRKRETLYTRKSHTLVAGYPISIGLGFVAAWRLFQNLFTPAMSPAISNAFSHMYKSSKLSIENNSSSSSPENLQVGFTIEEMTIRVEGLLRSIGMLNGFAPIVYMIGHGSSSANNPHHSAHDCGACSGKPGAINARVFAFMANHFDVRKALRIKGIDIPDETWFVGGLHDTASDLIEFYDEQSISARKMQKHEQNKAAFEKALDLNAKERSRRFASIDSTASLKKIRQEIQKRSVSMFEPRPELGHGTNALCVIGKRDMTKGLFLDRRAFLNSYDYKTDPEGKLLAGIMRPIGPVCGGINLEYYFSRTDNHKLGAGTKVPHNVVGLFGVANGTDGDLRPGLPVQMIEVHDPVRLLVIVAHFPEVLLKTIQSAPEMYEWYINEWVHLVAFNPEKGSFHYFKNGAFTEYVPSVTKTETVTDFQLLVESAKGMETNNIVDSTKENLPVYLIN
jgi:uncharacterized protein